MYLGEIADWLLFVFLWFCLILKAMHEQGYELSKLLMDCWWFLFDFVWFEKQCMTLRTKFRKINCERKCGENCDCGRPGPEQSSNKNWELAYLTNNNARILILNWSVLPSAWLTWLGKTWEIRALTQPNRDTKMIKMRRRMGSLDLPLHFKKNEFSRWSASQCCRWQFRQNGINNKV